MSFRVSNITNSVVDVDGTFWNIAQSREFKTLSDEILAAQAAGILLVIDLSVVEETIPKGFLGIKSVTSPHLLSNEDAGYVLVFNEETAAIINVPDGLDVGLEGGCRNKGIAQITIQPLGGSNMNVIGSGTVTNDSSKVSTFYVEDATTVVTSGDFA